METKIVEENVDFYGALDLVLRDKDVGFGFGELDSIEFKRHFKVESKRQLKGMSFSYMEELVGQIKEKR